MEQATLGRRKRLHSLTSEGDPVDIRPITREDYERLARFFERRPTAELTSPGAPFPGVRSSYRCFGEPTMEQVEYRIAVENGNVVCLGALRYPQAGPLRWVGEVSVVTDEQHRGLGVGRLILDEFLDVAKVLRMDKLVVSLAEDSPEEEPKEGADGSQVRVTVFKEHYRNSMGSTHDLLLLEMPCGRLLKEEE